MPGTVKLSGEEQIIVPTPAHNSALHAATAIAAVSAATVLLAALKQVATNARTSVKRRSGLLRAFDSKAASFVLLLMLLAIVGLAVYLRSSALNNGTPVSQFVGCARVVHTHS